MRRIIFPFFALALSLGCSATTSRRPHPTSRESARALEIEAAGPNGHRCHEGESRERYTCGADDPVASSDIESPDLRYVAMVENNVGRKFVHFADSCQHYFCPVDMECMKRHEAVYESSGAMYDDPCVRTTGCCRAHKVR